MRTGKTPAGLSPQAPELKLPKLVLGAVMASAKTLYCQTGWAAWLKSGKRKQCASTGICTNIPCTPFVFWHMPVRGKMAHPPRCVLVSLMRSVIDSAAYTLSMPSSRSRCFRQLPEPLVLRHLSSLPPALQLLQLELIRVRPLGSKSSHCKLLFTTRIAAAPSSSSRAWLLILAPDLAHLLTHKAI